MSHVSLHSAEPTRTATVKDCQQQLLEVMSIVLCFSAVKFLVLARFGEQESLRAT